MAKNNNQNVSNKYWENEEAIITSTQNAEVRYFKEAGKIQLYPKYESDGEMKVGKACVWSTENMTADECVQIVAAVMHGLLDNGVESEAFMTAYDAISDAVVEPDEDDVDEDALEEQALAKYNAMSIKELKALCKENDIEMEAGMKKADLVELLMDELGYEEVEAVIDEEFEDETPDEEPVTADPVYSGTWISFVNGEVVCTSYKKKADKEQAVEYLDYCNTNLDELRDIIDSNLTKTGKNKGKLNFSKTLVAIGEWVKSFELDDETTRKLDTIMGDYSRSLDGKTPEQAKNFSLEFMASFVRFIDNM